MGGVWLADWTVRWESRGDRCMGGVWLAGRAVRCKISGDRCTDEVWLAVRTVCRDSSGDRCSDEVWLAGWAVRWESSGDRCTDEVLLAVWTVRCERLGLFSLTSLTYSLSPRERYFLIFNVIYYRHSNGSLTRDRILAWWSGFSSPHNVINLITI